MEISETSYTILFLCFCGSVINFPLAVIHFAKVSLQEFINGYEENGIFSLTWTVHIFVQIVLTVVLFLFSEQEVNFLLRMMLPIAIGFLFLLVLHIFIKYINGEHWNRIVILIILGLFLLVATLFTPILKSYKSNQPYSGSVSESSEIQGEYRLIEIEKINETTYRVVYDKGRNCYVEEILPTKQVEIIISSEDESQKLVKTPEKYYIYIKAK